MRNDIERSTLVVFFILVVGLYGCFEQDSRETSLIHAWDVTEAWTGTPIFTNRANDSISDGRIELVLQQEGS